MNPASRQCQAIAMANSGFEDITELVSSDPFNFGLPIGRALYDPDSFVTRSVLEANTAYELTVEVGNVGSSPGFDRGGFPGYRVDLLAGGNVIAADDKSLCINERHFAFSTVSFTNAVGSFYTSNAQS